jgi:hypothetical protein
MVEESKGSIATVERSRAIVLHVAPPSVDLSTVNWG